MYVYALYNIHIKLCRPSVRYNPTITRSVRNSVLPFYILIEIECIGRSSLARENEAGDNWGQEVHILHVNV